MTQRGTSTHRVARLGAVPRAALVCLCIVGATTALGAWLYAQRLQQLEATTAMVATQASAHLEAWLDARATAMRMLALRWPQNYQSDLPAFRRDAELLQQRLPGLLALNWVDPGGVIRVVVPEQGNRAALGSNLFAHPDLDVSRALTEAMVSREPSRTRTLELLQGGTGFAFYWPVYGAGGELAGFVNGVFRVGELIEASRLAAELGNGFRIELRDVDGGLAWSNAPDTPRPWRLTAARRVPMAGGPELLMAVAPTPETIASAVSRVQLAALLGISFVVAVLLALATRRRSLEQARVERSERKFRELVDLLPHPVYVKDGRGRFTFVNRALADVCGRTATDLLGAGVESLPAEPLQQAALARADAEVLASGRSMPVRQETLRDAGGRERRLEMVRVPFLDPVSGTPSVLGMGVDVTERHESEAYSARIASALDQAGEAITVLDAAGRVVFANPAFADMMGFSGRSVLGLSMDAFAMDGSSDGELLAEIRETLARGETWKRRYGSLWSDGVERVRDATVAPVRNADGTLAGYIGVLRDVTREQQLEDELRQSQKLEAVGQLAGGIAHDFNNLLTVILGYATQLRDQAAAGVDGAASSNAAASVNGAASVNAAEAAAEIERAAERAADLTGQLLTFSRRRSRRSAVAHLNDVVRGLSPMLTRVIGENITVALDLDPDVAEVGAATSELEQVIVNLCVNARDAMQQGGSIRLWTARRETGAASARVQPDLPAGRYAVIGVSDTGTGMTWEVQRRIFEPFFTTKEVGAGTGLGLSTVYGIAEQRGGGVHVDSAPGRGTTVSVWLPVASALAEPATLPPPTFEAAADAAGGARILVVEDEEAIRELMSAALERAGHRVTSARDGADALRRCAGLGGLDLLVTDVVMPGMSGPELRDRLVSRYPDLRVLFVTGYAARQEEVDLLLPGDVLLTKPFRGRDLVAEVARVLGAAADRVTA